MANELIGVAELTAKLQELADPSRTARAVRSALSTAMNPVKKVAKANLSKISPGKRQLHKTYKGRWVSAGFAARSLRVKTFANRQKTKFSAALGVSREAFYAVTFFELGTSKLAKQPWLRPAFDATKQVALKSFSATLKKRVESIARKKGVSA